MIVGQEDIVEGVLTCLLGGGHAILQGFPGEDGVGAFVA